MIAKLPMSAKFHKLPLPNRQLDLIGGKGPAKQELRQ
jgi:hypothetical protein